MRYAVVARLLWELRVTQRELANETGMSAVVMSRSLQGFREFTTQEREAIAKFFRKPIEFVFWEPVTIWNVETTNSQCGNGIVVA